MNITTNHNSLTASQTLKTKAEQTRNSEEAV